MSASKLRDGAAPRLAATSRGALSALLAFGALNALGGGVYGLLGAKDIPTAWLSGSPFRDYFVPSLFLLVVVGGSLLVGAVAVLARWATARRAAFGAGAVLLGWIAVQIAIIGYVSWMQPATAVAALVILGLAARVPVTRIDVAAVAERNRTRSSARSRAWLAASWYAPACLDEHAPPPLVRLDPADSELREVVAHDLPKAACGDRDRAEHAPLDRRRDRGGRIEVPGRRALRGPPLHVD